MLSSASLALRGQALDRLIGHFKRLGMTQGELADLLEVSRPRVNALMNRRVELFSLDMLADFAERAGLTVRLSLTRHYRSES